MDAIIICGGQGTRVRSITNDAIPKILIPINGKPFLEYLIGTLYSQGVRRMVLAAGFLGGVLQEYLERRKVLSSVNPWMQININIEKEPLGTGGSVLNCLNRSGSGPHSDPFLIVNGDCLILPEKGADSYEELYYEANPYGEPDISMFTCRLKHDGRYGSLTIDHDGWITSFENGKKGESWINCGWYIVRYNLFKKWHNPICNRDKIQTFDVVPMSLERDLFPSYLEDGQTISPITSIDGFIEIGSPEALEEASRKLKEC